MMLRRATEDVVITTGDPHIHGGRLAVPKGTNLVVDLVGMRVYHIIHISTVLWY